MSKVIDYILEKEVRLSRKCHGGWYDLDWIKNPKKYARKTFARKKFFKYPHLRFDI